MTDIHIPKLIHYCWFSGEPFPRLIQKCIDSWRRFMPDYKLRLWDARSFDFESIPFVRDAIQLRKWAFAADYVRLYALFTEGGIYLDSDVRVYKSFNSFLSYRFFTSHEIHPLNATVDERDCVDQDGRPYDPTRLILWINIQAAIMGAERGHPFLERCLAFYQDKRLLNAKASDYREFIIGPHISKIAEQFGYRYHPREQRLADGMVIYPPEVFVGNSAYLTPESYALHLCNNSWHDRTGQKRLIYSLRNHFPAMSPVLGLWEKVTRNILKRVGRGTPR